MTGHGCQGVWLWVVLLSLAVPGCREDDTGGEVAPPAPPPEPELLEFPPELRAEDPAVNAFITQVIETCAAGDYEAFRLLWSAHDDPFPRDQFYQAWRLVRRVKILALRTFREAKTGELVYAARALVQLDPTVEEPERTVTILITQEDGRWGLTQPPTSLPEGLFEPEATPKTPTTQPT